MTKSALAVCIFTCAGGLLLGSLAYRLAKGGLPDEADAAASLSIAAALCALAVAGVALVVKSL